MYVYKYSVDMFLLCMIKLGFGGVLVVCGECYNIVYSRHGSFSQVLSHIPQSHMNWACSVNLITYFRAVQKVCTQEYCKDHTKYKIHCHSCYKLI